MTQFTPGPWKAINALGVWIVGCGDDHLLTKIPAGSVDAEANARLIAAAPELLDALNSLSAVCEQAQLRHGHGVWSQLLDDARAAIAKARGESQ